MYHFNTVCIFKYPALFFHNTGLPVLLLMATLQFTNHVFSPFNYYFNIRPHFVELIIIGFLHRFYTNIKIDCRFRTQGRT